MSALSIIVADDHPLIRAGLKTVLSVDPLCNLTAFARSGGECLELIRRPHPDVALIDANISLPRWISYPARVAGRSGHRFAF